MLLLFFKCLQVTNACCLGGAFNFLLLKQDKFISLFSLIGKFLPDRGLFFVVFFYLTFELQNFLLELWTVLALVPAFWKQKLFAEKLESEVFILTVDFINIFLQSYLPLKNFVYLDLKCLNWAIVFSHPLRILRKSSGSIFYRKLLPQIFDFSSQLSNYLTVIFDMEVYIKHIPLYNSFDLFRSVGVFQSVSRVFKTTPSRTNVRNHYCSTVATKTIFQEAR